MMRIALALALIIWTAWGLLLIHALYGVRVHDPTIAALVFLLATGNCVITAIIILVERRRPPLSHERTDYETTDFGSSR